MNTTPEGVLLLDADPDLGLGLSEEQFALARRHLRARVVLADPGPWEPPTDAAGDEHLGLLIVDGLLARDVALRGRSCVELLGAGDVVRPWDEVSEIGSISHDCRWDVLEATRFAVLDDRLSGVLARWPSIVKALLGRSVKRTRTMAVQFAVTQVPGVDVRLHLVLWHLADRWGRVTPSGVLLPLNLTHQMLARLIGARRPTVTSALQRLVREGLVSRTTEGGWLLRGAPDEVDLQPEPRRKLVAVA